MNFYESNLQSIKEFKTYLYKMIQEVDKTNISGMLDSIISVDSKEKSKALLIQYKGEKYRLNSTYRPVEEARRWTTQYEFLNYNNIISMFGFGNGVFAREMLNRMKAGDMLLIYEPCAEVFFHALEIYDLSDILKNSNVSIAVEGINTYEFHNNLLIKVNLTSLKTQIICSHPQYDKIFPYQYRDFLTELKNNNYQTIMNVNTAIFFGENMIQGSLRNLKYISGSNTLLDFYDDFPKDIPAIIISAGPSLRKNIKELMRAEGKAVIFAVDRALDFVLDNGITPDFVVTLDPEKPLEYFSTHNEVSIPLLIVLQASTEILEYHKGKKIIGDANPYICGIYEKLGKTIPKLFTGTSVATASFFACKQLGFQRIILVGQDLAYDGSFTHVSGDREEGSLSIKDVIVDGIYGDKIKTRYDWYQMLVWYQDMLRRFPDIEVIDATEGGAKISGSSIMTLKEAIDRYCVKEINCRDIVEQKVPTFSEKEIECFAQYLREGKKELKEIKKESQSAAVICERVMEQILSKTFTPTAEEREVRRLTEINKSISNKKINSMVDCYITAHAASDLCDIYQYTDEEEKNRLNTYNKAKKVYETTIDAVKFVDPLLDKAIRALMNSDSEGTQQDESQ